MKKSILMLAAAALMIAAPSCKKGENDPALSLKSRKGRVAGTYSFSTYETSSTYTDSDGDVSTSTTTLSGSTITTVNSYTPDGGSTTSTTSTGTLDKGEVVFEKDGTYSMTWNTTTVEVDEYSIFGTDYTETTTTTSTNVTTGSWNFLGKVDEYKNKERIVLHALVSTSTSASTTVTVADDGTSTTTTTTTNPSSSSTVNYSEGEFPSVYEIDMLKGKEMTFVLMEGGQNTYSSTSGGTTVTSTTSDSGSSTFTLVEE